MSDVSREFAALVKHMEGWLQANKAEAQACSAKAEALEEVIGLLKAHKNWSARAKPAATRKAKA